MFSYDKIFSNKQRILFVTAHPDDVIVFFGGLIARLVRDQKDIYVLLATNGARGSRENTISETELAGLRLNEEASALKVLGVPSENLFCLHYLDGEVESDLTLIGKVAKYIRRYKVDIVCTHEPNASYEETYAKDGYYVQHRDHRKIGEAVIDAAYPFSRDRSFFPEHAVEGIEPHTVKDILLTDERGCNFEHDFSQDIELKRNALRQHTSQFDEEKVEEILSGFVLTDGHVEKFNYIKLKW